MEPGKLTDEEFDIIKGHAAIGARLLANGHSEFVQLAEVIALSHHERWDGRGYPQRLEAEAIPLEGRIVAIADVFDALTNERPYKKRGQSTKLRLKSRNRAASSSTLAASQHFSKCASI